MGDTSRWRSGETNIVLVPAASDSVVADGDLVWLDRGHVRPVSDIVDRSGDLAAHQRLAHASFLGVATRPSGYDESEVIPVATSGVFEFNSTVTLVWVGDFIGADGHAYEPHLLNQRVMPVGLRELSIGRSVQHGRAAGKMLVAIRSTVMA